MKRTTITLISLAAVFTMASCQKDEQPSVQVGESTVSLSAGIANEVNYAVTWTDLTDKTEIVGTNVISIAFSSATAAEEDVEGTLEVDTAVLPSGYTLLPESAYTLTQSTSTIAKGETSGEPFVVTLIPEAVQDAGQYALTLKLSASGSNVKVSNGVVTVKFAKNINRTAPEGWSRISNDRFSFADYEGYASYDYTEYSMGLAQAFDNDLTTGWYSEGMCWDSDSNDWAYSDTDSYCGVFAELTFNEPVNIKGLIVAADPDNAYYPYRPHRVSIMFKYEGDSDYTWDKTFGDGYEYDENWNPIGESDEKDDAYYTFCPKLSDDAPQIEGYCPSPADFLITEAKYSTFAIDLSQKVNGRKVQSLVIMPAKLYVYQDGWNDTLQDFNYTYYYDGVQGVFTNEFIFFE